MYKSKMDSSIEAIENYFSNLNPIASKIMMDINETKSSYEHIWNELNMEEQKDIINETLIKPEIALRYFDSFSSSSSSSISNLPSEGDDRTEDTAAMLKNSNEAMKKTLNKDILNSVKKSYGYDGRNLSTYFKQKTGLKLIHDDIIGVFRDEHSIPFTFKTKSQIDLCVWVNDTNNTQKYKGKNQQHHHQSSSSAQNNSQIHAKKHKKLVNIENSMNLHSKTRKLSCGTAVPSNKLDESNNLGKADSKYERLDGTDDDDDNDNNGQNQICTIASISNDSTDDDLKSKFLSKFLCKNNLIFNTSNNLINKSNQLSQEEEEVNLMKNLSLSGLTSSSSVPSEEEEDKQTSEDSKLLLENDNLRKGFDFLNNW